VKLLDTAAWLSVQVHPDDAYARAHEGQPRGKSEVWYVLDAAPGAAILHGVAEAMSPAELRAAIQRGDLPERLARIEVQPGDVIHNPAGTIHALGPGILLYELQQASDLTYRLFDWGRDAAGGRALHVEPALAVARLAPEPAHQRSPVELAAAGARRTVLCRAEHFVALRLAGAEPADLDTGGAGYHIVTGLDGAAELLTGAGAVSVAPWTAVLVPAAAGPYRWRPGPLGAGAIVAAPLGAGEAADGALLAGLGLDAAADRRARAATAGAAAGAGGTALDTTPAGD
jgi:mannose-6-phosphate isomerase